MGRTLPWLVKSGPTKRSAADTATKRRRILDPVPEDELPPISITGVSSSRTRTMNQNVPRAARFSSSSPPATYEPPMEEFMRPGLSADDIYIMVEDEFLSTAKSFTQHLHQAEYKRLKARARSRNATSINDISRPIDLRSNMSTELHLKKQQEARSEKAENALEEAGLAEARTKNIRGEEVTIKPGQEQDPWVGTHLQGLMGSPRKSQPSLLGIQAITSTTRAAAGLGRPRRKEEGGRTFDLVPREHVRASGTKRTDAPPLSAGSSETEADDDDLDAAVVKRTARPASSAPKVPLPPPPERNVATYQRPDRDKPRSAETESIITTRALSKSIPQKSRVQPMQDLDSLDEVIKPTPLLSKRALAKQRLKQEQHASQLQKKDLHEIPLFLV